MATRREAQPKPTGKWKKWVAGAAAAAALGGIAEHKTSIGREMWLDHKAPSMRAPEHGGPLEKALEKYGTVHDFGPTNARKTVYVIPQVHPKVTTMEAGEDAINAHADIHFILDELGRRGVRFVYGEGVPSSARAELQVRGATKVGTGRRWEQTLDAKTLAGDANGVRNVKNPRSQTGGMPGGS